MVVIGMGKWESKKGDFATEKIIGRNLKTISKFHRKSKWPFTNDIIFEKRKVQCFTEFFVTFIQTQRIQIKLSN